MNTTLKIYDFLLVFGGFALVLVIAALLLYRVFSSRLAKLASAPTAKEPAGAIRESLAKAIPKYAFIVIGVLGVTIIVAAGLITFGPESANENTAFLDTTKYVLGVLLPVLSAWVGTIMAFYYSRENYEAAVKGTTALVKQLSPAERLRSIAAKSVMLSMSDPKTIKLELDKPEKDIKINSAILDTLLTDLNRLPIIKDGVVKYMIHKNYFLAYSREASKATPPKTDPSLQDMLDDPNYKDKFIAKAGFDTVKETATLEDVKSKIDASPNISDVFITADGEPGTKAIGWLTNAIVTKHAVA